MRTLFGFDLWGNLNGLLLTFFRLLPFFKAWPRARSACRSVPSDRPWVLGAGPWELGTRGSTRQHADEHAFFATRRAVPLSSLVRYRESPMCPLPGFGFSSPIKKALGPRKIGKILNKFMIKSEGPYSVLILKLGLFCSKVS